MRHLTTFATFILSLILLTIGCTNQRTLVKDVNAYKDIVSLYSHKDVSKNAPIVVRFVNEAYPEGEKARKTPNFKVSPTIKGELKWRDRYTLEFVPKEILESGTEYQVSIRLGDIYKGIPDSLNTFTFEMETRSQHLEITNINTVADGSKHYSLVGQIEAADNIEITALQKCLKAQYLKKDAEIKITKIHKRKFSFAVSKLERQLNREEITLSLDGSPIKIDSKDRRKLIIPALGDFKFIKAETSGQRKIKLTFSDLIDDDQLIEGLIHLDANKYNFHINENQVIISFKEDQVGKITVTSEPGLKNENGYSIQDRKELSVVFEPPLPQLKLVENKTILPYGSSLPFAFKAINLNAVDVQVLKVYEKNIPFFLQKNSIEDKYNLSRVGEVILTKKINLQKSGSINLKQWNKHVIDLKPMINNDPGALYKISIGFKRSYIIYPCKEIFNPNTDPGSIENGPSEPVTKKNFWELRNNSSSYDWKQRNNPCHPQFYKRSKRVISKNVLASNFGIIAKQEKDGDLFISVNKITNTLPISNATVQIVNYQNKTLKTVTTKADGTVKTSINGKPDLIIVKQGNKRGYLKLNYSYAQSYSKFDVSGTGTRQAIKGFLYAERGVWRPGDSIFVNLMLENFELNLPKDHPIGFELVNPKGQTVSQQVKTNGLNGLYTFYTKTSSDAITGNYYVRAYVGNKTFRKQLKIETIQPNRLKIDLDIPKKALYQNDSLPTTLTAMWLHGAKGRALKTTVRATLSKKHTSFKGYNDYKFEAPYRQFKPLEAMAFNGKTDENGNASWKSPIKVGHNATGFLNAHLDIKVFEKGGRFSKDQLTVPYYPFNNYVGIKSPQRDTRWGGYATGKTKTFNFVNLSTDGSVTEDTLIVTTYYLKWNWWYQLSRNDNYTYKGETNMKVIKRDTIITKTGTADWKIKIKDKNEGKYLVIAENSDGHKTGKVLEFYTTTYQAPQDEEKSGGEKMIKITTNKKEYAIGEQITLSIPTKEKGRALISLEDGHNIIESKWISVDNKVTNYSFTATKAMSPYLYAHVTYIQPHQHKENDLPLRMYGVIPIRVTNKNSHLHPIIKMKDEIQPNTTVDITVSEEEQREMTYTLAIVDEGLLSLTHYKTPSVWNKFHQKPALEIITWDIYDKVIQAGAFNPGNLLSLGGDGEANKKADGAKVNRFKPMVKCLGPFYKAPNKTNTHQVSIPNYVGAVRVVLIAGHKGAYGQASKTVAVKNPLMVIGTLPRVLGPGEEVVLPVNVFAMKNHIDHANVSITTNDIIDIEGKTNKTLQFSSLGDKQAFFKLKTKKQLGVAKINIHVACRKDTASYAITLKVRAPNPIRTTVTKETIPAGALLNKTLASIGLKGTNKYSVEISRIPPINLKNRLNYLMRYPYGCVEQTTSSVFPQLYLHTLTSLTPEKKIKIENNIKEGIKRLKRFQTNDGGLAYWPGGHETNDWGTNYAGHFLLQAKQMGFDINEHFLEDWINYQKNNAKKWRSSNDELTQAYRLYLLALAETPVLGAMNRMKVQLKPSSLASWYLAAAYAKIGQENVARKMIANSSFDVENYVTSGETFGSTYRNKAIILSVLCELDETDKAALIARSLATALSDNHRWMSTQTTAYSLLAMGQYIQQTGGNDALTFSWKNNGWKKVSTLKTLWEKEGNFATKKELAIQNTSDGTLFVTITNEGLPISKDTTTIHNKLSLSVHYTDRQGKTINVDSIAQGEDFIAEVSVRNHNLHKTIRRLALAQLFPSGWEIHNTRLSNNHNLWRNQTNYEDIRDDRVNMFYHLGAGETKTFKVYLNASYEGRYLLPAIQTEAMYDHSIQARLPSKWVNVIKQE